MDLHAELAACAAEPEKDRRSLYTSLLAATLYARGPEPGAWAVTRPDTGSRAVPAFLTAAAAETFWSAITPGRPPAVIAITLAALAAEAVQAGSLVIEPAGPGLVVSGAHLRTLARGEAPGEFTAWLRDPGRLARQSAEVMARLRRAQVHVITGKADSGEYRLYLLRKSDDGSQAVPCFSSPETLAQFVEVRRLRENGRPIGVALYAGEECIRIAAGLGAVVLVDPESPWETQLEPTLLDLQ